MFGLFVGMRVSKSTNKRIIAGIERKHQASELIYIMRPLMCDMINNPPVLFSPY